MARKKVPVQDALSYDVKTRINQRNFQKLQQLLLSSHHKNMSELLRAIICDKPITLYNKDDSLGALMEELVRLRKEINAIGININQVTRQINSTPEASQKLLHALSLTTLLGGVEAVKKELFPVIERLAEKWLQK
ncbi:plasmid mobilization relaxosome protein MobC [Chitinophaga sp. S165]|uniref:plasmid mobilization protein n=1 Tax=Chitinophaga sp. S165 TaxID=2135462 RepID=UPI000D718505|nr:plasmid mobilization relaxosome protein MobC [Chitinophaga sp. S165]PWV47112.1 mobilization protein MobC [Chitinophaga sp. S165]